MHFDLVSSLQARFRVLKEPFESVVVGNQEKTFWIKVKSANRHEVAVLFA